MLDYGINFNVEEGAKKALKEIEQWNKKWEAALKKSPLVINFDGKSIESLTNASPKLKATAKEVNSLGEQLKNLRSQFKGLTLEEVKSGKGQELINKYRTLQKEAGIFVGTIDQAVKAQDRMAKGTSNATSSIDRQTAAFKNQSQILSQLKNHALGYLSVYAAIRLAKNIVGITGEFEAQRISLQAILQDAEKGAAIFERIKSLAVVSPYTFKDLASYTKQLSAFSIPYEELYGTTKMLADAAAGLGVDMNRLVLAYGQIRSAAFLRGQEVRQLTEAGIPIIDELSKKFSALKGEMVSASEVTDMISKKMVSFEMVKEIFEDMTGAGGKFFNMQEKLADTLQGKVSNLTDAFQMFLAEIGEKGSGILKGTIDSTAWMMKNYDAIGRILLALVATYGTYKTALIAATAWEAVRSKTLYSQIKTLRLVAAAQTLLNKTIIAHPYIAITAAVVGLTTAVISYNKSINASQKAQEALNRENEQRAGLYENEREEIRKNLDIIKDDVSTRLQKQQALKRLQNMMPSVFSDLDMETAKVLGTTEAYRQYNEQVDRRAKSDIQKNINRANGIISAMGNTGTLAGSPELAKVVREIFGLSGFEYAFAATSAKIRPMLEEYIKKQKGELNKIDQEEYNSLPAEKKLSILQNQLDVLKKIYGITEGINLDLLPDDVRAEYVSLTKQIGVLGVSMKSHKVLFKDLLKDYGSAKDTLSGLQQSLRIGEATEEQVDEAAGRVDELKKKLERMGWKEPSESDIKKSQKDAKDRVKDYLDGIQDQIEEYKKKFEIWDMIYQHSGNKPEINFDLKFDGEPDLVKYVKSKMQEIGGGKLDLDVDFLTADFSNVLNGTNPDEQTAGTLKKYFDELRNIRLEQVKVNNELANKYKDYADKKLDIEKNLNNEIEKLEKLRSERGDEFVDKRINIAQKEAKAALTAIQKEILNKYGLDEFITDGDVSDFVKKKIRAALPLFKSLSEATLSELKKIDGVIDELELSPELLADFKEAGGDVEYLLELIEKVKKSAGEAVDERKMEKIVQQINKVMSSVKKLTGALSESSNELLSSIGEFLGGISDGADEIMSLYQKGDKATKADMIQTGISGIATILNTINTSLAENKKAQEEWNNAINESVQNMRLLRIEQLAYEEGSIFGMDAPLSKAVSGTKQYVASMKELSDIQKELEKGLVQVGTKKVPKGSAFAGFVVGGAGIGAAVGSIIPVVGTAIGAVIGGLLGGLAAGISSLFGSKATTKTVPIFETLKDKYGELFNPETFELNPAILADYSKLDEATRKIVDNWEEIRDKALEAQKQIEETLQEITGTIGEDLYNALIEAFGNKDLDSALETFRGKVNQILSDFAARTLFSSIFSDLFAEAEERMKDSLKTDGDQDIMDDIDWLAEEMEKGIPIFEQGLELVKGKMEELGRTLSFGESGSNLTGISKSVASITEDTALILGGYLDSLRIGFFDFSNYMRTEHRTTMGNMLEQQVQMTAHLALIEGNTRDTAQTNKQLVGILSSVVSPKGSNGSTHEVNIS